jgi:hypothetical protein
MELVRNVPQPAAKRSELAAVDSGEEGNGTAMKKQELLEQLRPVALEDKPLFDRYRARFPPTVSELTFTNVFCWAEVRHHLFCEHERHLLISYRQGDCCLSFYPPVGPDPAAVVNERIDGFRDYCWTRLDAELAGVLRPGMRPALDRDNSDYVYRVADLRTLPGKTYHGKRNYARRFTESYHPEVRPLSGELAPACLQIQERWLEEQRNNETARDESTALIKALRHFDALGVSGVAVFAGGDLVAFAAGESLNPSTFVEHFEKALPGYPGVYQFLLQAFAQSIPDRFPFLNREQDLGIDGLRRAKEGWHPALMVEKYRVRVRCQATPGSPKTEPQPLAGAAG